MENITFLLFAGILLLSCTKGEEGPDLPGPSPFQQSVRDTVFTNYFRRTSGWTAGDGGYSVRLTDGRTVWFWGDSHIGGYDPATGTVPCLFQVNNAALVQSAGNPSEMLTLTANSGFPPSLFQHPWGWPNYWFWPGAAFQKGDTLFVGLTNLKKTAGGGTFGFTSGGPMVWGKLHIPTGMVVGYQALPAQAGIVFNIGYISGGGDILYAFGNKNDGFLGTRAYLARFSKSQPASSWEYFNGSGWSSNPSQSAPVFADGSSSISSVFKMGNKYVGLSTAFSLGCDGKEIYAFVANAPQGPYSSRRLVYNIPDTLGGVYPFFYMAIGHPEFVNSRGVLVTYSVNGFLNCGPEVCVEGRKNPDWYRPKAFRLPLSLLQ